MVSAIATDIKDFALSADGLEAKFVLVTKYAGAIEVTIPTRCLKVLQWTEDHRSADHAPVEPGKELGAGNVTITVPKKWAMASDPRRQLVIAILDPQTRTQSGFALTPKAAKEFAVALVKSVDGLVSDTAKT
jgi:hypothetical protein